MSVKRRDLLREIRDAAAELGLTFASVRTKGRHEVFDLDGIRIPIPQHRDMAADRLGENWWKP